MKNIEITTTQNVTIEYQLGTLMDRGVAFFLDLLVLLISFLLFLWAFFVVESSIVWTIWTFVFVFYSLMMEVFNHGQSVGKMIMKIRVIRKDGEKIEILDYVMRWVFRALEIYCTFTAMAAMVIGTSRKSQRIGDILANTIVVRIDKKGGRMKLENLFKLGKLEGYQPQYLQVERMKETDMLLVKEVITRQKKHPNKAHKLALQSLVNKLEDELNIKAPEDKVKFLQILLKDYVALTR
ncbi:MAG: RDD family protein [Flavobacteriales bacterium]|nr:RDD family protein [Flavobacteriales bacterium]